MKKSFLIPALAVSLFFVSCQKSSLSPLDDSGIVTARRGADDPVVAPPANLPAAVLSSFNARYPNAARTEWQAEDDNTWKVKFFLGTQRWVAFFKADGTFISAQPKN
ncbi:MAG: hypothetical protein JNK14_01575 [Chitinophagaceae bacterium]|nr:hypothetical protein [Chitinophagaceae bacterium]